MSGLIEREGPRVLGEPHGGRGNEGGPGAAADDVLHRLRVAGVSVAVMTEAETRMRANLVRGTSWGRAQLHQPLERGAGLRCGCGAELVEAGWTGEATIRCGECGSRSHVTAFTGSALSINLSGPSEDWLETARPLRAAARAADIEGAAADEPRRLADYLRVDAELEAALSPVLDDLRATSTFRPEVEAWTWPGETGPSAMLWVDDSMAVGVTLPSDVSFDGRVVDIADRVQDWAVEALWHAGLPATWPECPTHPDSHPLEAQMLDCRAVWRCAGTERAISPIGRLGRLGRGL